MNVPRPARPSPRARKVVSVAQGDRLKGLYLRVAAPIRVVLHDADMCTRYESCALTARYYMTHENQEDGAPSLP